MLDSTMPYNITYRYPISPSPGIIYSETALFEYFYNVKNWGVIYWRSVNYWVSAIGKVSAIGGQLLGKTCFWVSAIGKFYGSKTMMKKHIKYF